MMNRFINTCLFLSLTLLMAVPFSGMAARQVKKIVLDAGHGGKDPGARGAISNEKDITLAVVLKLGQLIQQNMKDVQVVYTRTVDIYPSLSERHEIANSAKADLFISVHVNSTAGTTTRVYSGTKRVKSGKKYKTVPVYRTIHNRETSRTGTETYVLGLHRTGQKEDALADNADMVVDEGGMLNPNDPQTAIIIAQYSQAYLDKSINLGAKIEAEFAKTRRSDGVKQKGLEVLAGSAMPGVLVEIGFINNPEEERFLNTPEGITNVSQSIFNGIRNYKSEIERGNKINQTNNGN